MRKDGWLLYGAVLILLGVQAAHTWAFMEWLTLEDVAESLRGPYWWAERRTIFNGVASSVAYSASMAWAYDVFGFDIYLAKWLRLALHALSLLSLAELFRRLLGARHALVPLLAAGLSPTWLYLNTCQAQIGIDLQLAPVFVLAGLMLPLKGKKALLLLAAFGAAFCWNALIYPSPLFSLPSLLLLLGWRWRRENPGKGLSALAVPASCFAAGFLLPISGFLLTLRDPRLFLHDPVTGSGLFRGGGRGLTLDPPVVLSNLEAIVRDLFDQGGTYLFKIPGVELGGWAGWGAFGLLGLAVAKLWPRARREPLLAWLLFSVAVIFLVPQLVALSPGIRRAAVALLAGYGLLACLWDKAFVEKSFTGAGRWIVGAGVAALLVSHALAIRENLAFGRAQAREATLFWLNGPEGPRKQLEKWVLHAEAGGVLPCTLANLSHCRYAEIYGSIQAYRRWSGLPPAPVRAWDSRTKEYRELDISLWETREWPE